MLIRLRNVPHFGRINVGKCLPQVGVYPAILWFYAKVKIKMTTFKVNIHFIV